VAEDSKELQTYRAKNNGKIMEILIEEL